MDPIKKVTAVVNEYLSDFFQNYMNQLPTRDMDVIRQIVGQWSTVKQLFKPFVTQAMKDGNFDEAYVKAVLDDFKKASVLLDKLENHYESMLDFDFEDIKTHSEPLVKMIQKMGQPEEGETPDSIPKEEVAPEVPEEAEPMTKEATRVISSLDEIASEIEKESPQVALLIDKLADAIEKKHLL